MGGLWLVLGLLGRVRGEYFWIVMMIMFYWVNFEFSEFFKLYFLILVGSG